MVSPEAPLMLGWLEGPWLSPGSVSQHEWAKSHIDKRNVEQAYSDRCMVKCNSEALPTFQIIV